MREPIATPREVARELARKYSTMTHEELDVLESVLVPMKFSKGEIILREGEVCRNIYYVERGLIRQFYFTIFMCIESLFHEEHTHLQVEALEASYIYALPKHRLEQVALHNVNIQILFRKILEESLVISQVMADLVRFETAQERYRKFCKLAPQIVLRAPLVYVASFLQMTPETLSRVRSSTLLD